MTDLSRRHLLAASGVIAAAAALPAAAQTASQPAPGAFKGKSFLITGSSSGFGRLGALYYARLGGRVFATMRNLPRPEAEDLRRIARDEDLDLHILALDVRSDTPLVPETVVVPNFGMARWLSLAIARAHGICANVRFVLPAKLVWEVLGRVVGARMDMRRSFLLRAEHRSGHFLCGCGSRLAALPPAQQRAKPAQAQRPDDEEKRRRGDRRADILTDAGEHLPRQRPLVWARHEQSQDDLVKRGRESKDRSRYHTRNSQRQGHAPEHGDWRSS